jgi:hypothetical protein
MSFQVHGYFEHPETSKSRELARFTYRDDLKDLETAYQIARDWITTNRYPFVFIQDTATRISNQMKG